LLHKHPEHVHTREFPFGNATVYHLVFRTNDAVMRRNTVLTHLRSTATLFSVRMNYFFSSKTKGVRHVIVAPVTT
jgi:hypothetical protein